MADSQTRIAAFVRGFFLFLESKKIRSAVLFGGANGFEQELSDVDFVVDPQTFPQLAHHIHEYCDKTGWRLCQILRHETTAAYFVCSAPDDPSCAVALDACSDYQRNSTVFLKAAEMLENLEELPWGGHGLSLANELRYRFAKAAAKNKDAADAANEFASYPENAHRDCEAWLAARWDIVLASWNAADLDNSLRELRQRSRRRPSVCQAGSLARILSRALHPSGMIVISGTKDFDAIAAQFENTFGDLYFRRFRKADCWSPTFLKDLIASTLTIVPGIPGFWRILLPTGCIHRLRLGDDSETSCKELAVHLHHRCRSREN